MSVAAESPAAPGAEIARRWQGRRAGAHGLRPAPRNRNGAVIGEVRAVLRIGKAP